MSDNYKELCGELEELVNDLIEYAHPGDSIRIEFDELRERIRALDEAGPWAWATVTDSFTVPISIVAGGERARKHCVREAHLAKESFVGITGIRIVPLYKGSYEEV